MVNPLLLLLLSTTVGLQDPTQPLTSAVVQAESSAPEAVAPVALHLQAIFSGGHTSAIIDGKTYQIGDSVQNYRLVRIQPSQVVLQGTGKPLVLTLFPSL
ncbi:MSHA biogenesis protein MshK [Oceanisphaera sp. W20_SRM_FM3]|uniref:MSHA biogenesis protein MshK n=1 Tax=Oceanisphaera sp. W20_SRM_FM3 TaxID=3240267 RepID=UPI003F9678FD